MKKFARWLLLGILRQEMIATPCVMGIWIPLVTGGMKLLNNVAS